MRRYFLYAMIVCCAVACGKSAEPEDKPSDGTITIEAGLPSQMCKTALGEKNGNSWPLVWSAGDKLLLNGVPSAALSAAEAGGTSASFNFSGVGGASVWNYTYSGVEGSDCLVNFPGNVLPMYASATSVSGITLSTLGAVVRFSLKSSTAVTLSQIQVRALGGESISGNFSIGKDGSGRLNGSLAAASDNHDYLVVAADAALSSVPTAFTFVIPAGTYTTGFQASITASDGKIMEVWFNTKDNETVSAGTLYDFGESSFVAMGSSVMAVMSLEQLTVESVAY